MDLTLVAILLLLLALLLIRVVPESQRYALFQLGKFVGLRGPGVMLKRPFVQHRWMLIELGQQGELTTPSTAKFGGYHLPVVSNDDLPLGTAVLIVGFSETEIIVSPDPSAARQMQCPKCGHLFGIAGTPKSKASAEPSVMLPSL